MKYIQIFSSFQRENIDVNNIFITFNVMFSDNYSRVIKMRCWYFMEIFEKTKKKRKHEWKNIWIKWNELRKNTPIKPF